MFPKNIKIPKISRIIHRIRNNVDNACIDSTHSIIMGILYHTLKNKPKKRTVLGKTMTYHEGKGYFVSYNMGWKEYLATKMVGGDYGLISVISTAVRCSQNYRHPLVIYAVIQPKTICMTQEHVISAVKWLRERYPRLMEALMVLRENIDRSFIFITDGESSERPRKFVFCGTVYQLYYSSHDGVIRLVYAGETI